MRMKAVLLSFFLLFSFMMSVNAESFESKKDIPTDKTWTVTFNTAIESSSLMNNIHIKMDGSDVPLQQKVVMLDNKTVSLKAPTEGYLPSTDYTLYIDRVKSSKGVEMTEEVSMDFTTVAEKDLSLDVHFIDVGQGDAIFVQYPNGQTMLVDGGTKSAGEKVVSYLKAAGVTSIDKMVSTHPDADHLGGLITVMEELEVKQVVDSGKSHTTQTYEEYLTLIDQMDIPFLVPSEGDYLKMHPTVTTQVLNVESKSTDNNEASIVLKITYGENDVLLTGDAGIEQELEMINEFDVEAEILKAGHHGSDTSSSSEFLEAVSPEDTVLSYGEDNRYGHPIDTVVNNLKALGSDLYSTAESGDIVFSITPTDYEVTATPWDGGGNPSDPDPEPDPDPFPINVNTASYEELQLIKGVGPRIAQNIIDYRNANGPFETIAELDNVKYIGPATIEEMRPYITLG